MPQGLAAALAQASGQATGRCKFPLGRIANPSYNHSAVGMFPTAGRLSMARSHPPDVFGVSSHSAIAHRTAPMTPPYRAHTAHEFGRGSRVRSMRSMRSMDARHTEHGTGRHDRWLPRVRRRRACAERPPGVGRKPGEKWHENASESCHFVPLFRPVYGFAELALVSLRQSLGIAETGPAAEWHRNHELPPRKCRADGSQWPTTGNRGNGDILVAERRHHSHERRRKSRPHVKRCKFERGRGVRSMRSMCAAWRRPVRLCWLSLACRSNREPVATLNSRPTRVVPRETTRSQGCHQASLWYN